MFQNNLLELVISDFITQIVNSFSLPYKRKHKIRLSTILNRTVFANVARHEEQAACAWQPFFGD